MNYPKKQIQAHHQIILDSIADGVFTVDKEMNITSFNRAAEDITGFSRKDAIGLPCYAVLRANVCEESCLLRQTIDTEQPVINFPVYILRADKKLIPISVTTALLKDAAGRVVGGVETFRDLTAVDKLRKVIRKQHSFEDIVSKNATMLDLFAILPQVAESNCSVLIEGDSGTGKELFARAIHNNSTRRNGPFVAVNCGALPDSLCESELFGYKAGAFTDAKKDKPGRFALAENGTLFLDEIGDVSPAVQSRLLRVLEEKVYEPLGATETYASNARVITATNRDLQQLVREGKFRDDLYFRIDIVKLSLPSLSKRKEDIPLLLDHFIDQFNHLTGKKIMGISRKAVAALMLYDWPGNVRELENAIEHAFVLCLEGMIRLHHLPARVVPQGGLPSESRGLSLRDAEKRTILKALERNQWKKMATARELEIDKNTLRRKIKRLGIIEPQV
ncbi:sigma 54-interacting transcriptional regulator [Breoghania sp.]|uniref:sigma-54 interaction domain-containing protein n=1 Tax=Breoghania sp. TaxID=2065378 RepID=UPI0029C9737C|nr:sigma 54-interacting transcriptional regulator [Breoghania sp.]